jgi:hypothetical protein
MSQPRISKTRPVSWKIYVQDEAAARWARERLENAGMKTGGIERAPDLHDPPVFSFVATSPLEATLTQSELEALLQDQVDADLAFDRA